MPVSLFMDFKFWSRPDTFRFMYLGR